MEDRVRKSDTFNWRSRIRRENGAMIIFKDTMIANSRLVKRPVCPVSHRQDK